MSHFKINTSQNVQIEFPTANVGFRLLSQLLDYVFIGVYLFIVTFIIGFLRIYGYTNIIFFLPAIFYGFFMETFFNGQSFGKMILKIKVVRLDGSQATVLHYFIRWAFWIIDWLPFYGITAIIAIAVSNRGQRIGDRAAGTTVVSLQKKYNFRNTVYRAVSEDYKLQFPQVEMLSDSDISTINEVLLHFVKNPGINSKNLLEKTKAAIITKTNIVTSMQTLPFLRTLVKDYNYVLRNETD